MNFKKTYRKIKLLFEQNGVDENCASFCADVLNEGRLNIHFKKEITLGDYFKLMLAAKKRVKGAPTNKILKNQVFYGRDFYIDNNVLAPRVDTEFVVSEALEYIKKESKVLDLCTGSGIIAITIKKESGANVFASDISSKALKIAKKNALTNEAEVTFVQSDMFENIMEKGFDLIISNPPYIPSKDVSCLSKEVKDYDPIIALDGGEDGLDYYRIIEKNLSLYLLEEGKLILEIGYDEGESIKELFSNYNTIIKKDYEGNDRVAIISYKKVNNARKTKKN